MIDHYSYFRPLILISLSYLSHGLSQWECVHTCRHTSWLQHPHNLLIAFLFYFRTSDNFTFLCDLSLISSSSLWAYKILSLISYLVGGNFWAKYWDKFDSLSSKVSTDWSGEMFALSFLPLACRWFLYFVTSMLFNSRL